MTTKKPSLLAHLRDIIILPFSVTVIIPFFILKVNRTMVTVNLLIIKIPGALVFLLGLSLFLYTVYLFRMYGNGTLAPWNPTQKLVISGPYKYCRNPMISGVFFILTGETLFLNSINLLIWTVSFFIINTIYFVIMEEPDLLEKFGSEYERYKKNVPRWIPKFRPYQQNT